MTSEDYLKTVDEMEELLLAFKTMTGIVGERAPYPKFSDHPELRVAAAYVWLEEQEPRMHKMIGRAVSHRRAQFLGLFETVCLETVDELLRGIDFLRFLPPDTGDPWHLMELAVAAGTPHLPPIYPDHVKALK